MLRSVFAGVLMLTLLPGGVAAAQAPARLAAGVYIVTLAGGEPAAVAADHARNHGAAIERVYAHALAGYAARLPPRAVRAIARDPRVSNVVADQRIALDPDEMAFGIAAEAATTGQRIPTGIRRVGADRSRTRSGDGRGGVSVDVAVIDTGIDRDHPDLNVVGGVNCVGRGSNYDDGNGHGTHVAGTIAARDNGRGVVGVAPGARLHAVRVLDSQGNGSFSSIICGVDWVTARAGVIEVANMSLTGFAPTGHCRDGGLHEAVCDSVKAGVTYVVAAGNQRVNASRVVPASYDQVITVSGLADFDGRSGGRARPTCSYDRDDTFADFSNYGADVDVVAPGVCILSTYRGGGYQTMSGTSMASPHVAGAAALYLAHHRSASPQRVQAALTGAGSSSWTSSDDGDRIKEPLLDVSGM